MDNLVFIRSNKLDAEPYTTSDVVAKHGKAKHETVQRLIRNYENDLRNLARCFKSDLQKVGKKSIGLGWPDKESSEGR